MPIPPELLIYSLATYRIALFLSDDTGPYHIFSRLRGALRRQAKRSPAVKNSDVAAGISCIRCNSVWIATPIAAFAYWHKDLPEWIQAAGNLVVLLCALSAAVILCNRALPAK